jgi:hypothetical protein
LSWRHTKGANNKPPSGIPASGIPARGGPASGFPAGGDGWGGPENGFVYKPSKLRTAESLHRAQRKIRDNPAMAEERKILAAAKAEREEQFIQRLGEIALNSTNEMAAVAACDKALDRIVGKAPQTNKNLNVNVLDGLSIEQQRAVLQILEALTGNQGSASEGDAETHH